MIRIKVLKYRYSRGEGGGGKFKIKKEGMVG